MLIDAVYNNGNVIFSKPYSFHHNRFDIKVEVPEVEIIWHVTHVNNQKITLQPDSQTLQAELRSIYKDALAADDASDDKISEKQNTHWASAEMYSSVKEQGIEK